MTYSIYGSREYVETQPAVEGEPVGGRHFTTWDESNSNLPAAAWLAREHPGCGIALATTSLSTQIAVVRAGLGLAAIPDFLTVNDDFIWVIPSDPMFGN